MAEEVHNAHVLKRRSMLKSSSSADLSNSYDYCMVFKLEGEPGQLKQSDVAKYCVKKMTDAGLELFKYLSVQHDELIILIRAPANVMKNFADAIDFRMELNPDKVKELLEAGYIKGDKYLVKPIFINQDEKYSGISPFNFIYGKYDNDYDQSLYLDFENDSNRTAQYKQEDPPFNSFIRLKLLDYMIRGAERFGGCDIEVSKLLYRKRMAAYFPLHDRNITTQLNHQAMEWGVWPWTFPFDDYRYYFGEKITLFMVFFGHYSYYLLIPSVIGFVFQLVVWGTVDFSSPVLPFFCLIITIWTIVMLEHWKRLEKMTALKWGMLGFEENQPDRPEFRGELITSYIDGQPMLYFPDEIQRERKFGSQTVILGFMALLIGVVSCIYVLRLSLQSQLGSLASFIASVLNTVQITIFNIVYQYTAIYLTDKENLRTATEYEDSLILKLFTFQFINSYSSFFYLAFVAQYLDRPDDVADDYMGQCGYSNCMQPLSINLAIIFGTRLILNNLIQLLVPDIKNKLKRKEETKNIAIDVVLTPPEEDYILLQYNDQIDNITNYADAAIQFGFSTLFVSALPIAPAASLASNYVKSKVIAWNLTKVYQRPIPAGAEDIGSWLTVFQFLSVASVITNAALVCFTMNVLDDYSTLGRAWVFIGFHYVLFSMQFLIEAAIPDIPEEVEIQMKRNAFITSKIIDHTPDENPVLVREYTGNEADRTISTATTVDQSTDSKGGCYSCFSDTHGVQYMRKKDYTGCPEVQTATYPKQNAPGGMINNPMNA